MQEYGWETESIALLKEINAFPLDPEVLRSVIGSLNEADPAEKDDLEGWMAVIARALFACGLNGDDAVVASMSVQFRLSALSRFLNAGGGRGFTLQNSGKDGWHLDEAVLACVAEAPLVEEEGPVRFDHERIERSLLELARPGGAA